MMKHFFLSEKEVYVYISIMHYKETRHVFV